MSRKLWLHQEYTVNKFKDREFCGLLFPCGCGKTLAAIALAEEKEKPVLIIAPNALCEQWKDEIEDKKEKDWEVLVCTSKTRKTKKFKTAFIEFCTEKD